MSSNEPQNGIEISISLEGTSTANQTAASVGETIAQQQVANEPVILSPWQQLQPLRRAITTWAMLSPISSPDLELPNRELTRSRTLRRRTVTASDIQFALALPTQPDRNDSNYQRVPDMARNLDV